MPTLNALQIPPPENWQDFESLCCDLWRELWQDPNAQRYGREGQEQSGVDIFGRPRQGTEWAGIQCKLKNQLLGKRLKRKEIEMEVKKARRFNPRLASFTIATTAPRDVQAQETAREITEKNKKQDLFTVSIISWEDIIDQLSSFPELLAKHYPGLQLADRSTRSSLIRNNYLRNVWSRLLPLPLLGVGGDASRREDVPLSAVYTALDVTAEIRMPGDETVYFSRSLPEMFMGLRGEENYLNDLWQRTWEEAVVSVRTGRPENWRRRCTALEAAAAAPRLVLLGPAGSGKSTFARYLTLSLAGEALGREEANLSLLNNISNGEKQESLAWPHGAPLPVFIELRQFVRSKVFPKMREVEEARHLLDFFETVWKEQPGLGDLFREALAVPTGALVVLDGFDETPAAEKSRERLRSVISSFVRRFPECRIMITSRPYSYARGSPWRLDYEGFEEATLAPFDSAQAQIFIGGWYRHLAQRGQTSLDQAQRRSRDLVREIESTEYLTPLAERPLMLTMMTDLHAAGGGRLRGGRASLYERSVELLLDRWNELRDVPEGGTVAEELGMDVDQIRSALEWLAYEVHLERGSAKGASDAEITDIELWTALGKERSKENLVDERRIMDYLHQRSGILLGVSPTRFRFPHRSYQEYLAACYLIKNKFPNLLRDVVRRDPLLWREVVLHAADKVASTPFMVWALLETLVPDAPPKTVEASNPQLAQAFEEGPEACPTRKASSGCCSRATGAGSWSALCGRRKATAPGRPRCAASRGWLASA
ncbi:MAG: NACHT domain-containing protein [bacterium]|nr:NACHT domain-containing protein [bacterium]